MIFQIKPKIRYSEVDQKGNLTIVSLVNYLQDCAAFHSDSVGHGLDNLIQVGQGWFITNWQLIIHSLPKYGEEISISTWPYDLKGMFCRRYFTIENQAGERLVSASSLWVFMDIATAKPIRIPDDAVAAYGEEKNIPDEDWGGRKIVRFPEESFTWVGQTEVMPVHLDTNRHMNNAYYIEIARDTLPKEKKIFGIRVEYKKPAKLSDLIHIRSAQIDTKTQVVLENDAGEAFSIIEFTLG